MNIIQQLLIVSVTPYFLEKDNTWLEQNLNKILAARKTRSFFEDNTLFLEKNQKVHLSEFLRKLDEMGYEKVLKVSEPGEFSQQGGIVDVFPINKNTAFRIDFLGNKVEEIIELPLRVESEKNAKEILKKRLKSQKLFSDLKGIKAGDYLVHLDHGVSRFLGIKDDYYVLEYAQADKLYVPLGLERKLSRYIGFVEPKISRLGSNLWQRTKKKIKEEAEIFAKELLEVYAKRETATRAPYQENNEIDLKLAAAFPFQETADQIQAMEDIKNDLEQKTKPMDRIVCGDVGFGKTEVALRTMVKAINSGYQAALLCPTTILANQHLQNFEKRLKNLPIKIALLSRLQTKREQKEVIEGIKGGAIDIVIGTHRLLSKDIEFKNLGLLVIDDEQRFGVRQKEKLKKIRTQLDVLSLSATPIPRTLYLSLSSLKDISLIQLPPLGRLPIKTFVLPWSEKIIKKAVEKEVKRGGQVYYLHNRVETIEMVKKFLEGLLPKVNFAVVHGRMKEKQLIETMERFSNYSRGRVRIPERSPKGEARLRYSHAKKIDVLIATTIIENGLDLANVNTLIVDDATRLGLAEAYQIRGRVGRSHRQAFSYFFFGKHLSEKAYPVRSRRLSNEAKMRLEILKEAEELGSGYKIALKDLEMRGAGNILGKEQSGNINRVGLNLYCQILSEAIEKLKTAPLLYDRIKVEQF